MFAQVHCHAGLSFARTNEVHPHVMQQVWASARTNEVHSRVMQHVWASARTNEVRFCVSSMFGWASFNVHWSMFRLYV